MLGSGTAVSIRAAVAERQSRAAAQRGSPRGSVSALDSAGGGRRSCGGAPPSGEIEEERLEESGKSVLHILYSDGLATVSAFIVEAAEAKAKPALDTMCRDVYAEEPAAASRPPKGVA